jgi:hypothetical protein
MLRGGIAMRSMTRMGPDEDDVRVHNDHDSSSAGMIVHPRTSGTSELRPVSTNRLEMSVRSPQPGVSSVPTAEWRMRRTSSSMLRPCSLARCCKSVFTAVSMFRTTICATIRRLSGVRCKARESKIIIRQIAVAEAGHRVAATQIRLRQGRLQIVAESLPLGCP